MAKSDKTQDENLNTKCFSDLLFLAKGKRSSIDFCNECGISPSMFSRYLNQKNKRSCPIEILKKVAAHAAPESGVTFDILVAAYDGTASCDYVLHPDISIHEVIGIITTVLLMKQYQCKYPSKDTAVNIMGLTYKPSWTIETTAIDTVNMKKWDFFIWNIFGSTATEEDRFVRQLLIIIGAKHLGYINFDKLTFIFTDYALFQSIIQKASSLEIDCCISLLYIDSVAKRIVQEYALKSTLTFAQVLSPVNMDVSDNTLLFPDKNNLL